MAKKLMKPINTSNVIAAEYENTYICSLWISYANIFLYFRGNIATDRLDLTVNKTGKNIV